MVACARICAAPWSRRRSARSIAGPRYKLVEVDFPDAASPAGPLDPFFNTNRPEDLDEAAGYLG